MSDSFVPGGSAMTRENCTRSAKLRAPHPALLGRGLLPTLGPDDEGAVDDRDVDVTLGVDAQELGAHDEGRLPSVNSSTQYELDPGAAWR